MSGRRTSGTSRPSLGAQVHAVFSFISYGKSQFKKKDREGDWKVQTSFSQTSAKAWTPAPKRAFFCGPSDGEKLFDPGASRRKGQECLQEIRTENSMFVLFFLP